MLAVLGRRAARKGYRAVAAGMNNLTVVARAEMSILHNQQAIVGIFGVEAGMR